MRSLHIMMSTLKALYTDQTTIDKVGNRDSISTSRLTRLGYDRNRRLQLANQTLDINRQRKSCQQYLSSSRALPERSVHPSVTLSHASVITHLRFVISRSSQRTAQWANGPTAHITPPDALRPGLRFLSCIVLAMHAPSDILCLIRMFRNQ